MNVRLLAPAAAELDEELAWYAAQTLERRFINGAAPSRQSEGWSNKALT